MAGKDIIMATQEELQRLKMIGKAIEEVITQKKAAEILNLSARQVRRIMRRVEIEGNSGIIHKARGKESNRKLACKEKVLKIFQSRYEDFGPTLASEKLWEYEKIKISDETLRLWLIEAGIAYPQRKGRKHRQWRERKEHLGEMIQMDGSHHDWFEGRAVKCVLMGYIDDATGKPFGRFYPYEGLMPAMDSFRRYVKRNGIPQRIYIDRHAAYQSKRKQTLEEELSDQKPKTQFERALKELGVKVIHAQSAQAKGRVERLFKTFQDRLIKEMRLRGISRIEDGNNFLESYANGYFRRFGVKAAQEEDLHRSVPAGLDLERIFCIKEKRTVRNDWTVMYNGKLYQIKDRMRSRQVEVEERLDGKIILRDHGKKLLFLEIQKRPEKQVEKRLKTTPKNPYVPFKDNPWRQFVINPQKAQYPQKEKVAPKEKGRLRLLAAA